ncbi:IS4 family transposase, partial [Aeoliella sp. ICT_H6.2]|nr:IS4 family transposase [Aeoliella straminimaris]
LKVALQMDVLRCKTPELVRKEIWTHVLAYNLIRTLIAQAATKHELLPRSISFKATMQLLEAFQPLLAMAKRSQEERTTLYGQLLDSVAVHRVADRPDRFEPRLRKRRFKKYDYMMTPRKEAKREMLKQLRKK